MWAQARSALVHCAAQGVPVLRAVRGGDGDEDSSAWVVVAHSLSEQSALTLASYSPGWGPLAVGFSPVSCVGGVLRYLASKSKANGRESGQEEGSGGFHGARLSL